MKLSVKCNVKEKIETFSVNIKLRSVGSYGDDRR